MCGIQRPTLLSCSARIAWIGGQADPDGMTTRAVLWVTCVMTGYSGWRPTPMTKRRSARAAPRVPARAERRVTGDRPGPSRRGGLASVDSYYARGGDVPE